MARSDKDKPLAPSAEHRQNPHYPRLLRRALKKHGLRDPHGEMVERLVSGDMSPRMIRCCGTGCRPCARDYLGAARDVLVDLKDPPPLGLRERLPSLGVRRRLRNLLGGERS